MADRCPRCFTELDITGGYTDDPIKTPHGEAGDDYKGFTNIKPIHIQELQTLRAQQEIDAGITEEDRTEFTEIDTEHNLVDVYRTHILELRESTEKILTALGQTKDTYFNYDEDGTEYNIGNHQTDWKDSDLGEKDEDGNYIKRFVDIKAYHIEDLRHYILAEIPMLLVNRFINYNTVDDSVIIPACYSLGCKQEYSIFNCNVMWWNTFQEEDSCGVTYPYASPAWTVSPKNVCWGITDGYVINEIAYTHQFMGSRGSKFRKGINCRRSYYNYNTFKMDLAIYPNQDADVATWEDYSMKFFYSCS